MQVDIHQHIWTEPLLDALARRRSFPFVRRRNGLTVLHCNGEQPYVIDVEAERPQRRASLLRADGIDEACVALSSPIGIEALPREDALALIAAHREGLRELPDGFSVWSPVPLDRIDAGDVDRALGPRSVGVSLPAAALAGREALATIGPVLERAATRRVPLFVHPGPAPGARIAGEAPLHEPLWWRPLTDYVAQMQAAWLTFAALGRREHPELTIVFAMLAGGAPLLCERLEARGGPPVAVRDPRTYYDTSSYGPAAVEAMARRVGPEQLVYGSDRPVVEPAMTGRERLLRENAARVLQRASA